MSKVGLSVGWDLRLIDKLLGSVEKNSDIKFIHSLTVSESKIVDIKRKYPYYEFEALSKCKRDNLPEPDYELLSGLETEGVPTIKNMILGDPYLRYMEIEKSLSYATLIAKKLISIIEKYKPDFVIASHDRIHSGISLAVSKKMQIPFVALAFTVIPENLTGFCNYLTPNSLVPIHRNLTEEIKNEAAQTIELYRKNKQKIMAFKAPFGTYSYLKKLNNHVKNYIKRICDETELDEFSMPPFWASFSNIIRRTFNRVRLPTRYMIHTPPSCRYVYYPLHMSPESMIDTWAPFYQNQLHFLQQLSRAIPINLKFVIKLHFSDPDNYSPHELKKLISIPGVLIAHPNASGREFIEKSTLVVGITGTSCLEAALLRKPVLIFGDSPYVNFPRSERAGTLDQLHSQILKMINRPPPDESEILDAYSRYLARYMHGISNDWNNEISKKDTVSLTNCFNQLVAYINVRENVEKWYDCPSEVKI